jgi:hypothetical protein
MSYQSIFSLRTVLISIVIAAVCTCFFGRAAKAQSWTELSAELAVLVNSETANVGIERQILSDLVKGQFRVFITCPEAKNVEEYPECPMGINTWLDNFSATHQEVLLSPIYEEPPLMTFAESVDVVPPEPMRNYDKTLLDPESTFGRSLPASPPLGGLNARPCGGDNGMVA